ncbi:MAG: hypothetical protein R6V19_07610 [Armatimonadota bacterium]
MHTRCENHGAGRYNSGWQAGCRIAKQEVAPVSDKSPQEHLDALWTDVWADFKDSLPDALREDIGDDFLESFEEGWYRAEMPALRKHYLEVYRAKFQKFRRCPDPDDVLAEVLQRLYDTFEDKREELQKLAKQ